MSVPRTARRRASPGHTSTLHVRRTGPVVTWSVGTGAPAPCATGVTQDARVSVGVRGPPSAVRGVATRLQITRVAAP